MLPELGYLISETFAWVALGLGGEVLADDSLSVHERRAKPMPDSRRRLQTLRY